MTARSWTLGLAVLVVVVALVYAPGLHGGYAFDDFANIVDNPALSVRGGWRDWVAAAFSSPASELQRPLAMLTFAFNRWLTGDAPGPMKLTNLVVHLTNLVLVALLARALLRRAVALGAAPVERADAAALGIAAWWGLASINLMGVLFIVQRMESLSHTFVFLGLLGYLAARERRLRGGAAMPGLVVALGAGTVLGTLAKESAVLLPLYAFLVEALLFRFRDAAGRRDRALLALYGLVLLLPALAGLAWLLPKTLAPAAYAARPFDLTQRLLTEGRVLCDYLRWTVVPDLGSLSLYHDDYPVSTGWFAPATTAVAWLALAALLAAAFALRRRRPLAALGIALWFAAHLLTATVIPLELVYEHRNYFASFGLILALADLLLLAPLPLAYARSAVFGALVLVAGGLTHLRAREWSDPVRFDVSEAAKHPASPRATYALGRTYVVLSDYDPSSPYVEKAYAALEQARVAPGATLLPEQGLLVLAARTGHPLDPAWWRSATDKLSARAPGPQDTTALASLVACANGTDCPLPSAPLLELLWAAMSSSGESPEVLTIYANYAFNALRDPDLALRLAQAAAEKAPGNPGFQANLAKILIALRRYDAAAQCIARLRGIGRLGQNASLADALDERLRTARAGDARL